MVSLLSSTPHFTARRVDDEDARFVSRPLRRRDAWTCNAIQRVVACKIRGTLQVESSPASVSYHRDKVYA